MARALCIDERDNVATCLDDASEEEVVACLGSSETKEVIARQRVASGHKIALRRIERGSRVTKYGEMIGRAKEDILPGDWVHLHNCGEVYGESTEGRQT